MTAKKSKTATMSSDEGAEEKTVSVSDELVSYRGRATVELLRGGRTYRSYSVKNQGCLPLFKFLGLCLAESFDSRLAPYGLRLFNVGAADMGTEDIMSCFTTDKQTTTAIVPKSSVDVDVDESKSSVSAALTFVIPFTVLQKDTTSTVIAIYSRRYSDDDGIGKPLAFIRLAKKQEDGSWKINDNEKIVGDGKSNIKISWKMTVADGSEN